MDAIHIRMSSSVVVAVFAVLILPYSFSKAFTPESHSTITTRPTPISKSRPNRLGGDDEKMVIIVPPHPDDKMIVVPGDCVEYR